MARIWHFCVEHKKFKKMFANKKKLLTFASPFEGNTLES